MPSTRRVNPTDDRSGVQQAAFGTGSGRASAMSSIQYSVSAVAQPLVLVEGRLGQQARSSLPVPKTAHDRQSAEARRN